MAVQVWRYVCCELWHWLKAVGHTLGRRAGLPLGKEGKTIPIYIRNATLIIEYLSLAGFAIQKLFSYGSGKIL